jgi:excisionase family DNA binding protein
MAQIPDSRLLLRPAESAEALGISRAQFYRLLRRGAFGNIAVKVGASTRISRRALEAWIAGQIDGGRGEGNDAD